MSDFGDFDDGDAFDTEPADPEQVAAKLHELRRLIDELAGGAGLPTWDELEPASREFASGIGDVIVDYLIAHEPDDPEPVARNLHEARRYLASSRLPPWEELPVEDRAIGVELMGLIIRWLERQGAIA